MVNVFTNEPGQPSDVGHVTEQMARFVRLWIRHLHDAVDHPSLTPARLRVLGSLRVDGPQIMQRLADALVTSPRNVTTLVDGLEREGLVVRSVHPDDRRATVVSLTPAGEELTARWWEEYLVKAGAVFAALPPADRRRLSSLIDRLSAALERATDRERGSRARSA